MTDELCRYVFTQLGMRFGGEKLSGKFRDVAISVFYNHDGFQPLFSTLTRRWTFNTFTAQYFDSRGGDLPFLELYDDVGIHVYWNNHANGYVPWDDDLGVILALNTLKSPEESYALLDYLKEKGLFSL